MQKLGKYGFGTDLCCNLHENPHRAAITNLVVDTRTLGATHLIVLTIFCG